MTAFNDAQAGQALSRLARQRATDAEIAKPADVCLFAWLAAEAARRKSNPIQLTVTQVQHGFSDEQGDVDKVGLSLNTIHTGLQRLCKGGFLGIADVKTLRGGGALLEITING